MERDLFFDPAPVGRARRPPAPFAGEPWPGRDRTQRLQPARLFPFSKSSTPLPRLSQRQALALAGLLASAALVSAACTGNHRPASPAAGTGTFSRGVASWYGPKFNGRRTASGERYDMRALTAAHPSLPFGTLVQVTNVENGRQVVVRINDRGPFGRRRVIDVSYAAARQLAMVGPGTAEVELAILNQAEPEPPMQPFLLASAGPPASPAPLPAGDAGSVDPGLEAAASSPQQPPGAPIDPASPGASVAPAPPLVVAAAAVASAASPGSGPAAEPASLRAPAPPTPAAPRSTGRAAANGKTSAHYTVQVGAFGEIERADALQQNVARLYPEAAVHSDGIWHRVQVGLFGDREVAEGLRRELAALGLEAVVVAAR